MEENNISISVVIISYNGLEFIEDCLNSVMKSVERSNSEVIVVDNGSSDGTLDIIRQFYPKVVLISNKENLGFARAVNQGLKIAKGDYILLLNQDTKIIGNAIADMADRMQSVKNIGSIGPKFVGFDGIIQKSARSFLRYRDLLFFYTGLSFLFPRSRIFSNWKMGWFDHETEREVDQPMGAALMISKEVLGKIGYFDESFGIFFNDVDYCRRIKNAGYINLYYPEAVIAHYIGGSTRKKKAVMVIESHRSMYRYFKKYSYKKSARPFLWFWGGVLMITAYIRAGLIALFKK